MERIHNKKTSLTEKAEYRQLIKKWIKIHFRILWWLTFIGIAAELLISILVWKEQLASISLGHYALKYLIIPASGSMLVVVLCRFFLSRKKLQEIQRAYIVTFAISANCFILASVHNVFYSIGCIFLLPIFLTSFYGDYRLTTSAYGITFVLLIISQVFVTWDTTRLDNQTRELALCNLAIVLVCLLAGYGICIFIIYYEKERQELFYEQMIEIRENKDRANKDELTGLYNRRGLKEAFSRLEYNPEKGIYFVMIDINKMKTVNDTYGHGKGDEILKFLGNVLCSYNSDKQMSFRIGGDEFCILFYEHSKSQVETICRKIQESFKMKQLEEKLWNDENVISVSIGIAELTEGMSAEELSHLADQLMYKEKGKKASFLI
ncbi:MAG: GGDEF domain-containing protein [Lachnospiraceae bacterium]|nr:GGDEF domain-containing protein [Lachnospiraceae bacterium]